MKKYILLLNLVLCSTIIGQTDAREATDSPKDMTIARAVETIAEADERFEENQSEVLDDSIVNDGDDNGEEVVDEEPVAILNFGSSTSSDPEPSITQSIEEVDPKTQPIEGDEVVIIEEDSVVGVEDVIIEEEIFVEEEMAPEDEISNTTIEEESIAAGKIEKSQSEPVLPDAPQFEIPDEEVFLELPGGEEGSSSLAKEADTISIDFPQEDVRNIIRNVADLYELNVVIPDSLTGSVSIKLRDVTWRQVMQVILEPLNYTYMEDGNIIMIKSQDDLAIEPVDTRVFIINFAKAAEIKSSIEPLVNSATGGKIQVDNRSNALVITERPSRMNGIQEIIETLDRPTEQVMIESKFVEITGRDQRDVGIDWQSLSGYGVRAGPFNRQYSDENRRESLDDIGTSGNTTDSNTNTDFNTSGNFSTSFGNNTDWSGNLLRADTALFSADAFSLVLSALERNTDVELISNPTIVTLNNTPAQINIGEEYPIPAYTYNAEQGTYEVSNFEYKNIGINLNVIPQINSAGFINLNIEPEISSRTGEVPFGGAGGALIPIITTRKTQSTVTIKSGYTLAIGGLIEKNTENRDSKIPVLGSIPVLGKLFSNQSKAIDQRNLIVFITAKILSASGATYRDVFSQRTLYEMGIKARDLPGYEPPASERELFDDIQNSRDEIERLRTEIKLREQLELLNSATTKEQKSQTDGEPEVRRRFK